MAELMILKRAIHAGSGVGSRAPNASHRRLESWIRRELQAVLQLQDVSLLASLVMGVALSFKAAERPSEQQPGANEQAVQALAPYLGADAQHFWHELRYCCVSFSIELWVHMDMHATHSFDVHFWSLDIHD